MNDPTDGTPDADLRRDVRLVTSLLGETLKRAEGEDLLALVERVRTLAKDDTLAELPELDLATTTKLARAFTAYFHLANVAEQVHRGRTLLRARRDEGGPTGWVHDALARVQEAGIDSETIAKEIPQVAVRPVFTAHPTEVARRSTIEKMRQVAALLEQPDTPRRTRRLEEAVETLWRTDEIRVEPPQPIDEARNGVYYLEGLAAAALPDVLEELRDQLAAIDVRLPAEVRPLRFGTWIGGTATATPTSHPRPRAPSSSCRPCTASGCSPAR